MATLRSATRLRQVNHLALENLPPPAWPERACDWVVQNRLPLSYLAFGVLIGCELLLGVRPRAIGNLGDPLVSGCLLLILAGLAIRSWAAGIVHKNRGLATTGPYGFCRHPLYLGSALVLGGMTFLMSEVWWTAPPLVLALLAVYILTIRREEERLAARLGGTWTAYAKRTPRLLPIFRPDLRRSDWSLAVWRHNREAYTQLCVLLGLAGLALWRTANR